MTVLDPELFLPEPAPRSVRRTIISVDDHVVEPGHLFDRYLPAGLRERGPQLVENERGHQIWQFEGQTFSQVGMNAVAGRRPETVRLEPFRFEQMRPGCYDPAARVADMDLGGIWASLNFPSQITGFCGRVFFNSADREIGIASIDAWNDWFFHEWYEPYPQRFIPCGIAYLSDPTVAAAQIRSNAERGFRSISMPERPHAIGLPSLWDREHWEPILRACAETETVVSLHVGSSGMHPTPPGAPSLQLGATMFGQLSLGACAEWVWSGFPKDIPELKIAMSEGGIGWVAMLIDRLENIIDRSGYGLGWDIRPADVLRRNFWFCTLDDPSTISTRHAIGIDKIMLETDYPHGDGTWPDTQALVDKVWSDVPEAELELICSVNAAKLFRHPLPPS